LRAVTRARMIAWTAPAGKATRPGRGVGLTNVPCSTAFAVGGSTPGLAAGTTGCCGRGRARGRGNGGKIGRCGGLSVAAVACDPGLPTCPCSTAAPSVGSLRVLLRERRVDAGEGVREGEGTAGTPGGRTSRSSRRHPPIPHCPRPLARPRPQSDPQLPPPAVKPASTARSQRRSPRPQSPAPAVNPVLPCQSQRASVGAGAAAAAAGRGHAAGRYRRPATCGADETRRGETQAGLLRGAGGAGQREQPLVRLPDRLETCAAGTAGVFVEGHRVHQKRERACTTKNDRPPDRVSSRDVA
jgi:hypothetical protein